MMTTGYLTSIQIRHQLPLVVNSEGVASGWVLLYHRPARERENVLNVKAARSNERDTGERATEVSNTRDGTGGRERERGWRGETEREREGERGKEGGKEGGRERDRGLRDRQHGRERDRETGRERNRDGRGSGREREEERHERKRERTEIETDRQHDRESRVFEFELFSDFT